MHLIYGLCDSGEPGVVRYVGKTTLMQRRLADHIRGRAGVTHKETWIRYVRAAGREVQVTEIAVASTNDEANRIERHYIALFRSMGMDLTNATDGGDGQSRGWNPSEETRQRMREAQLKRPPRSPEFYKAIGAKTRGKKKSPAAVAKMRAAKTGVKLPPRTEEYRERMSLVKTGKRLRPLSDERKARLREAQRNFLARHPEHLAKMRAGRGLPPAQGA